LIHGLKFKPPEEGLTNRARIGDKRKRLALPGATVTVHGALKVAIGRFHASYILPSA
jgi:hypothetical protein